jgi:hypothetical protein
MLIMKNSIKILTFCLLTLLSTHVTGQTAYSLFRLSDSLQVNEVVFDQAECSGFLGHGGPAVENTHMALRLCLDGSGAIDVFSKSARGMELRQYLWNTTPGQQDTLLVGTDGYTVHETLGLGGVALWDGNAEVALCGCRELKVMAGETKKGAFAEVIYYGVPYIGDHVDISVRIDMTGKTREAVVTATELAGKKVVFLTGVNRHKGQKVTLAEGIISVWGPHPDQEKPFPIGAGMRYSVKDFPTVEEGDAMIRIISKPLSRMTTRIVSGSVKEAELNSAKRFEAYMMN